MIEERFVAEFNISKARAEMSHEAFIEWFHKERDFGDNISGQPITHFKEGKYYIFHREKCTDLELRMLSYDYRMTPEYMVPFDGKPHLCIRANSSISFRFGAVFEGQVNKSIYRYGRSISYWEEIQ